REFGIRHLLGIKQPDSRRPERDLEEFIALDRFSSILPSERPGDQQDEEG
ncbi:MAG: haloacid dehalogenase, partial [Onishia taeanensis]